MATYRGFTTVEVTSTSADYEVLTDAGVQAELIDRLDITAEEYAELLSGNEFDKGVRNMNFQILGSGFNVSINNETYQPLFDDSIYSSGDFVRREINSIRVSADAVTFQFRINLL